MVWSDYTQKTYEFGEPVRLTSSWTASKDNTYRLKLLRPQPEKDQYQLEIELL